MPEYEWEQHLSPDVLGARLKAVRERAGLSYGQVIMLMGRQYPQQFPDLFYALAAIEDGNTEEDEHISPKLLIALAHLYDIQLTQLVMPESDSLPSEPGEIMMAYLAGRISGGTAAHLLGIDRLDLRTRAEEYEEEGD